MADIQLVIKIPEEIYNYIKKQVSEGVTDLLKVYIAKGIPIPKDTGRLKDVDAFLSKVKADREHSAYVESWTADDVLNALNNSYASTIIEGYKEQDKE